MYSKLNISRGSPIVIWYAKRTGWRRPIGCLIFMGHFPENSRIISGSLMKKTVNVVAIAIWYPHHTQTHTRTHTQTQIHKHTHATEFSGQRHLTAIEWGHTLSHTNTRTHTYTYTHIHTYTHTHAHPHTLSRARAHTHTHTHKHTHTIEFSTQRPFTASEWGPTIFLPVPPSW